MAGYDLEKEFLKAEIAEHRSIKAGIADYKEAEIAAARVQTIAMQERMEMESSCRKNILQKYHELKDKNQKLEDENQKLRYEIQKLKEAIFQSSRG